MTLPNSTDNIGERRVMSCSWIRVIQRYAIFLHVFQFNLCLLFAIQSVTFLVDFCICMSSLSTQSMEWQNSIGTEIVDLDCIKNALFWWLIDKWGVYLRNGETYEAEILHVQSRVPKDLLHIQLVMIMQRTEMTGHNKLVTDNELWMLQIWNRVDM